MEVTKRVREKERKRDRGHGEGTSLLEKKDKMGDGGGEESVSEWGPSSSGEILGPVWPLLKEGDKRRGGGCAWRFKHGRMCEQSHRREAKFKTYSR